MVDIVINALGREVPLTVNGYRYEPYRGAAADIAPGPEYCAPTVEMQGSGETKVRKTLDEVIEECVPENGWISFTHYYRDDPTALRLVVESLRRCRLRGVKLLGIAFFGSQADVLLPALRDGTLAGIEGNVYRNCRESWPGCFGA